MGLDTSYNNIIPSSPYNIRVSAGLKFTSDILSKQPQYCSDIWKIFRTFFQTLIFTIINKTAICPSHNETRGSFATISDGKCGLIDWLPFYLMGRLQKVDRWLGGSGWGTDFTAICGRCRTL